LKGRSVVENECGGLKLDSERYSSGSLERRVGGGRRRQTFAGGRGGRRRRDVKDTAAKAAVVRVRRSRPRRGSGLHPQRRADQLTSM
jgi:hypothetical protein